MSGPGLFLRLFLRLFLLFLFLRLFLLFLFLRLFGGEVVGVDVQAYLPERALHRMADVVLVLAGEVDEVLAEVGAFEVVVDAGLPETALYFPHGRVVELQLVQVPFLLLLQSFLGHLAAVDLVLDGRARGVRAGLRELCAGAEHGEERALGDPEHEPRASGDDVLDGVLDLLLCLFLDWHDGFLSVGGWCFPGGSDGPSTLVLLVLFALLVLFVAAGGVDLVFDGGQLALVPVARVLAAFHFLAGLDH